MKFGLRTIVILLFLVLYISSLILLNSFFVGQQKKTNEAIRNIQFDEVLSSLSFEAKEDSIKAENLMIKFRESMALSRIIQNEAQVYSTVALLFVMLVSGFIFIKILYRVTGPLKELQSATAKIREGNFSIRLPETGIKEIRNLKQSFNQMSSELQSVQEKLLETEKDIIRKNLSRILAHEIKNPLTPIRLSIQRLEEKYYSEDPKFKEIFPESVDIISQEIGNLQNLAKSFSEFAKPLVPEFEIFCVNEIISENIKPYKHTSSIHFEPKVNCEIRFDKTHFYQVFTNLLQNAIDASEKSGKIVISLSESGSKIILKIADKGCGISKENLDKIFEPYFTKKKKGTGLGLALVKKLVEINESNIKVTSRQNEGTTFELMFPKVGL